MKHLLATLVVVSALGAAANACPMCKDSVPNQEGAATSLRDSYDAGGQNISGGMNASVYVMLATLIGTIGLVSTVMVKGVRSSATTQRGFPVRPSDPRPEEPSDQSKSL
jgi:hypothetical protein